MNEEPKLFMLNAVIGAKMRVECRDDENDGRGCFPVTRLYEACEDS